MRAAREGVFPIADKFPDGREKGRGALRRDARTPRPGAVCRPLLPVSPSFCKEAGRRGRGRGENLRFAVAMAAVVLAGVAPSVAPAAGAQAPAMPAPSPVSPTILVTLTGLRLVDAPAKIEDPRRIAWGVSVDGPKLLDDPALIRRLRPFIGRPFTQASMQSIAAVIKDWYRTHNRPFVDVSFPEQDISGFKVQAVVTEYRLGKVRVRGNRWFADWLLRSDISLKSGNAIDAARLNDDVAWIDQNSYRQVQVVGETSATPGAVDLVLQTTDRLPWMFSAGFDNTGLPATGRAHWTATIDWGNAFFLDQDISYQFSSSEDFWLRPQDVPVKDHRATFQGHQASWTIPLPWRDRLVFMGNFIEQRPDLGPFFTQLGTSWQSSVRYVIDLPATDSLTQEIQFGFDFKRTNNNLSFGGTSISKTPTEIDQFPVTYNAVLSDPLGRTVFFDEIVFSPGHMTAQNTNAAFQPSTTQIGVPGAKAQYVYGDADVTRLTRLPFDTSWIVRLQSQLATSNLLQSEQLGLGGVDSVRGYDERAANGSLGVLASNELRSPPVGVVDALLGTKTGDQLQFDAFFDYGHVWEDTATSALDNVTLASVGAGVHYVLGRFVNIRFEYGWQLKDAPGETRPKSEPCLSAVISY